MDPVEIKLPKSAFYPHQGQERVGQARTQLGVFGHTHSSWEQLTATAPSSGQKLGTSLTSAVLARTGLSVHGLLHACAKIPAKFHAVSLLVFGVWVEPCSSFPLLCFAPLATAPRPQPQSHVLQFETSRDKEPTCWPMAQGEAVLSQKMGCTQTEWAGWAFREGCVCLPAALKHGPALTAAYFHVPVSSGLHQASERGMLFWAMPTKCDFPHGCKPGEDKKPMKSLIECLHKKSSQGYQEHEFGLDEVPVSHGEQHAFIESLSLLPLEL